MVFRGKVVKTDADYAFVLVDNANEICDNNCGSCGHVCGQQKPVWKTENSIGANEGDEVKVQSSTWKMFVGKLPEVVETI